MSEAGINWSDITTLTEAGINWNDLQVMSEAGINWQDFTTMSEAGINWSDLVTMSEAGVNWSDIQVMANAGIDRSNVHSPPGEECVLLLPRDADASAEALRAGLHGLLGLTLGIVISDSFGRPWRNGVVNVALGTAGLPALSRAGSAGGLNTPSHRLVQP